MIEVKERLRGVLRRRGRLEAWDPGRSTRSWAEGRIDEVRCRLAVEETTGGKAGGALGAWEVEEELLDELAELERVVSEGTGAGEFPIRINKEGGAGWAEGAGA